MSRTRTISDIRFNDPGDPPNPLLLMEFSVDPFGWMYPFVRTGNDDQVIPEKTILLEAVTRLSGESKNPLWESAKYEAIVDGKFMILNER